MFNQFNLSCDLMEPFRPFVDLKVRLMEPRQFEKSEKIELLKLLSEEFIIDEQKNTLLNTIKIYSKSIFHALEEDDTALIRFARK